MSYYGAAGERIFLSVDSPIAHDASAVTGIVDMRHFDRATVQLIVENNTLNFGGAWKIEFSNDYVQDSAGGSYGQEPTAGHWTDITSSFSPAIVPVVAGTAASFSQFAQIDISCRALRFTFTPSGSTGVGSPLALGQSRSWA